MSNAQRKGVGGLSTGKKQKAKKQKAKENKAKNKGDLPACKKHCSNCRAS